MNLSWLQFTEALIEAYLRYHAEGDGVESEIVKIKNIRTKMRIGVYSEFVMPNWKILHGVFRKKSMQGHVYFYIRDPKYLESLTVETHRDFTTENPKAAGKTPTSQTENQGVL